MMKVVAIIQARMGSTRLPGKVMKTILGKPVILWDIERLELSKLIEEIIIAIPFGSENDIIERTVLANTNATIFRGSENDVLDRYYHAALVSDADVVVRVTSDCPLIDSHVVDRVIDHFLNNDCDYCSNTIIRSYPRGLDAEVFSFASLEKAWKEAELDYEREHVTPYIIFDSSSVFKKLNVSNDTDLSHLRWTLDTTEDFELIDIIYKKIFPHKKLFFMGDILDLIGKQPELIEINRYVEQKKIK
ncbi:glycosyltransferase family protein [Methanolobus psychrotolerans]|uniref:glycosyltransferase family protein n=1 Tax=Methanolobus psychrotolerans TaxID=1874706 RepID=UPI001F5D198F|nr:glycosyltransferase family protein [Methanolobus psychrotolerans]